MLYIKSLYFGDNNDHNIKQIHLYNDIIKHNVIVGKNYLRNEKSLYFLKEIVTFMKTQRLIFIKSLYINCYL